MQPQLDLLLDDYDRGRLSRRRLMTYLTGLAAAMAAAPRSVGQDADPPDDAEGAESPATFTATDINHIALSVTDLDRSQKFYERHLGLRVTRRSRNSCFMSCAENNFVALFRSETPGLDHYCYSMADYDADEVVAKLKAAGLDPRRSGNRVYFDDPDGIEVQLASQLHTA